MSNDRVDVEAALIEALEPFARLADPETERGDRVWAEDRDNWRASDHEWGKHIDVGMIRRARSALELSRLRKIEEGVLSSQPLDAEVEPLSVGVEPATVWRTIDSAPRNGTLIMGRRTYADRYTGKLKYEKHRTWWGKTSHVPLYGFNWGKDVEDLNLWTPTHWRAVKS